MDSIDLLGYAAGTLVVISLLPQVVKSWKTKSTKDISLARYAIYITGLLLWIAYALLIGNGPVAMMNSVGLILAICVLALKLKYG
ncbi:MAG: SemiSWEET transporter [Candidatus Micrarchaeia archaeon]|jgi:MtN3 and saliva related transmembrane protein